MRCYFMRGGHIAAVELVTDDSDEAAINQGKALFEQRRQEFAGFEVWDRERFVYRHPSLPPKYTASPDAGAAGNVSAAGGSEARPEAGGAEKAE